MTYIGAMRLFPPRKPNVHRLRRKQRVEGLIGALGYHDRLFDQDGNVIDLGAPLREEAVWALWEVGSPEARRAVLEVGLRDEDERVRLAAVRAARGAQAPDVAYPIVEDPGWPGAPDSDGAADEAFELTLAEVQGSKNASLSTVFAAALLEQADGNELSPGDRETLTSIMVDANEAQIAEVMRLLVAGLCSYRAVVQGRAAELMRLLPDASVEALIGVLSDDEMGVGARRRAAVVLGELKDTLAIGALSATIYDDDAELRRLGVQALGELKDPRTIEMLLAASRDTDYAVRRVAADALNELGTVAVVMGFGSVLHRLLPATTGESRDIVTEAAGQLAEGGFEAGEAPGVVRGHANESSRAGSDSDPGVELLNARLAAADAARAEAEERAARAQRAREEALDALKEARASAERAAEAAGKAGSSAGEASAALVKARNAAKEEVDKLSAELDSQTARARELERQLEALERSTGADRPAPGADDSVVEAG